MSLYRAFSEPFPPLSDESGGFVCLPVQRNWLSSLLTVVSELAVSENWQSDGDRCSGEFRNLLNVISGELECEMIEDVILDGCVLKKVVNGGTSDIGDLSDCGAVGPEGPEGPEGPIGPPGASGTTSNPENTTQGPDSHVKRCAVATNVASWAIDKFGDSLDAFKASYQLIASYEAAASDMIDAVPVVGAFINAAMDFAREIVDWDIVNLIACITEEFEDHVFCSLYCALGEDGLITDDVFGVWWDSVADYAPCGFALTLVGTVMSLQMRAVGAQNYRNRAYMFSTMETPCRIPCSFCPDEFCETDDFTVSESGWSPYNNDPNYGVWEGGVGWHTGVTGAYHDATLSKEFEPITVVSVDVTLNLEVMGDNAYLSFYDSYYRIYLTETGTQTHTVIFDEPVLFDGIIYLDFLAGSNGVGSGIISKIEYQCE